jgi:hypothetical protein
MAIKSAWTIATSFVKSGDSVRVCDLPIGDGWPKVTPAAYLRLVVSEYIKEEGNVTYHMLSMSHVHM